jgi:nicotinamidase-related amidase
MGTWRCYYERWASMTLERLDPAMIELVPELRALSPPAHVLDKRVYSPWLDDTLQGWMQARGVATMVVTGGETDVCVLATVLGAVDRGYRVVVVTDALYSSSDETHEALLRLYRDRFGQQVETAKVDEILSAWGC